MNRRTFVKQLAAAGARTALAGAAAGAWTAIAGDATKAFPAAQAAVDSPPPLKKLGEACGLRVGCTISKSQLREFPGFAHFFSSNFALLTPNSEMIWTKLHPAADRYDFSGADAIMSFAESNGIAVHGTNLAWNAVVPAWLKTTLTKANARGILQEHIKTVMTRYKGKMDSWDVVNEPIGTWFSRPDGLYAGPWLDALGPEYIDIAFTTAAEVDPKPLRVLNVHNVEHGDSGVPTTRTATLNLIKRLVKTGIPIQAVGIESHLDAWRPLNPVTMSAFIKDIRDLGLQVFITELDVNDATIDGDIATRDQAVAKYYREYTEAFYAAAGTRNRFILWSATDRQNWMDYMGDAARWKRSDGQNNHRPGLLDYDLNPKPSLSAVASAIQNVCRS